MMVQCEVIHLVSRVLNSPQDKYLHCQWCTRERIKTKRWSTEAGMILFMLATTFLISPQCCLAFWCCDCSRPAWSQAVVPGSRNMWGSFSDSSGIWHNITSCSMSTSYFCLASFSLSLFAFRLLFWHLLFFCCLLIFVTNPSLPPS